MATKRRPAPTPADAAAVPLARTALPDEVQAHLEHLRFGKRLAERTLSMYHDALVRLVAFAAEAERPLTDVQPFHVRRWAAQLHGSGLGPRSIAIHLAAWRSLYQHWGRDGRVRLNPVEGVRAPKGAKPLPKALSVDHAVALAELQREPPPPSRAIDESRHAALEARDQAIVELLYGCGLRVAELIGLDMTPVADSRGWLDLDSGEAHVLGKGSKRRSVPVAGSALQAVQRWRLQRAVLAADGEQALFVSLRGTRLSDGQLRVRLAQRAQAAGLPTGVHPHMLRHSYASHLLQSSGDLRAVQELLGHAQISTTQVYTKLDFQHLAQVYDAAHPRAKKR
jgi:integrase/recombinase XerC